jgi:predicted DsbA family dithiol-disulfide isomerase
MPRWLASSARECGRRNARPIVLVHDGVKVEIFSDVVGPWCYLARARFRGAVTRFGGDVAVSWQPFQLDPGASGGGLADERLAERFGRPGRIAQMHDRMRELLAAEGLPYEPERAVRANRRAAHRIITLAEGGRAGRRDRAAVRDVPRRRPGSERSRDVGEPWPPRPGLDGVRERLAAGEGDAEVTARLETAHAIGVTGVPFFVFDGKWAVSGAQSGTSWRTCCEVAVQT